MVAAAYFAARTEYLARLTIAAAQIASLPGDLETTGFAGEVRGFAGFGQLHAGISMANTRKHRKLFAIFASVLCRLLCHGGGFVVLMVGGSYSLVGANW